MDMVLVVDAGKHMVEDETLWDETKSFLNKTLVRLPISKTQYRVRM